MDQDLQHEPNFGVNLDKSINYQYKPLSPRSISALEVHSLIIQTSRYFHFDNKTNPRQEYKNQMVYNMDQNRKLLEQRVIMLEKRNFTLQNENNQLVLERNCKLRIEELEQEIVDLRNVVVGGDNQSLVGSKQGYFQTLPRRRDQSFSTLNYPETSKHNKNDEFQPGKFLQRGYYRVTEKSEYSTTKLNLIKQQEIQHSNVMIDQLRQKLNQHIDGLLNKQSQHQPEVQELKMKLSTVFESMTASFLDYSNEKIKYENKIVQIMKQMTGYRDKERKMKKEITQLKKSYEGLVRSREG